MTEIKKQIEPEKDLTTFIVLGEFSFDKITDLVNQLYASDYTLNVIYDLSRADMSSVTGDQLEKVAELSRTYAHLRQGGKTAFVVSEDLTYGLTRMYETFSELDSHPLSHHVCKNMSDALLWMES